MIHESHDISRGDKGGSHLTPNTIAQTMHGIGKLNQHFNLTKHNKTMDQTILNLVATIVVVAEKIDSIKSDVKLNLHSEIPVLKGMSVAVLSDLLQSLNVELNSIS